MRKVSILLLVFTVACGPSEDEIQARIDEAVEKVTSTTTTSTTTTSTTTTSTTTTTIDTVGLCRENVAKVNDLFENKIRPAFNDEYRSYLVELNETWNGYEYNFKDVDVEKSWFKFLTKLEVILEIEKELPTPVNGSLYQEYYFTIDKIVTYFGLLAENWLRLQAGYSYEEYLEKIETNTDMMFEWRDELLSLPSCSTSNN